MLRPPKRPFMELEIGGKSVMSTEIPDYAKCSDFHAKDFTYLELTLPVDSHYRPPMSIRCWDVLNFGRKLLVGKHVVHDMDVFLVERGDIMDGADTCSVNMEAVTQCEDTVSYLSDDDPPQAAKTRQGDGQADHEFVLRHRGTKKRSCDMDIEANRHLDETHEDDDDDSEDDEGDTVVKDWWTKYYASQGAHQIDPRHIFLRQRFEHTVEQKQPLQSMKSWMQKQTRVIKHITAKQKKKVKHVMQANGDVKMPSPRPERKPSGFSEVSTVESNVPTQQVDSLVLYPNELEAQPEFGHFDDVIQSFELSRGRQSFENPFVKKTTYAGVFKGNIKMSRSPLSEIQLSRLMLKEKAAVTKFMDILVRVYIVRARNLPAADITGSSDPFIQLKLGDLKICDSENRVNQNLNPVFGRSYDLKTRLSTGNSTLRVQVMDFNRMMRDDFLGETRIDIEQRFYTRHRATCGLPATYSATGYNSWYDMHKPKDQLKLLCEFHHLDAPKYGRRSVMIGKHRFALEKTVNNAEDEESAALHVLNNWCSISTSYPGVGCALVPEHVETRHLFDERYPAEPRGQLEMFVHIFPVSSAPPAINIFPRKPKSYQLRVVVWSTCEVPLTDTNRLTGCSSVDQYIRVHLIDPKIDTQKTDVHYRSLDGDGMFNWRCVFNMDYLDAEQVMVYRGRTAWYSIDEAEVRKEPVINIELWDADVFTKDSMLGSLSLNMNTVPAGAKTADDCNWDIMDSRYRCNLFQSHHVRGWWPFKPASSLVSRTDARIAGKIELEIELLTKGDADECPAGQGRDEPKALQKPLRPETSFAWFASPIKFLRLSVWRRFRCSFVIGLLIVLGIWFLLVGLYSFPNSIVMRIVGL